MPQWRPDIYIIPIILGVDFDALYIKQFSFPIGKSAGGLFFTLDSVIMTMTLHN